MNKAIECLNKEIRKRLPDAAQQGGTEVPRHFLLIGKLEQAILEDNKPPSTVDLAKGNPVTVYMGMDVLLVRDFTYLKIISK
jgi:hypothetical protein